MGAFLCFWVVSVVVKYGLWIAVQETPALPWARAAFMFVAPEGWFLYAMDKGEGMLLLLLACWGVGWALIFTGLVARFAKLRANP